MRRIIPAILILGLAAAYLSCAHSNNASIGITNVAKARQFAYAPDDGPLCEQDIYFVTDMELSNRMLRDMADVCNAFAIMHAAMSDFECWVRFDVYTDATLLAARSSVIADKQLREQVFRYLQQMASLIDTTMFAEEDHFDAMNEAWQLYCDLDSAIVVGHHVENYGALDDSTFWSHYDKSVKVPDYADIKQQFGSDDQQLSNRLISCFDKAKDIDQKCIYALALAHVSDSTTDDGYNIAVPFLLSCMHSGKYSIYLCEVWRTWRTLVQRAHGASKDSDLLNQCFNRVRMTCLQTILRQIAVTGGDILAVNNFLVMSSVENIHRYGVFPYGNQNIMEYFELFPERCPDLGGGDEAVDSVEVTAWQPLAPDESTGNLLEI